MPSFYMQRRFETLCMQVPDSAKWQTPGESGLEKGDPQGKNVSRGFEREPIHVAGAE